MELLTWIPLAIAIAAISWFLLASPHGHPHSGRHYSRGDRRRYVH